MGFQEYILMSFSRDPGAEDYIAGGNERSIENALSLLEREYPDLDMLLTGKRVIDFGCGTGYQSIALVKNFDCSVFGIDLNTKTLEKARENAKPFDFPESKLSFVDKISDDMLNQFDIVISQNSFEHFGNPSMILDEMRGLINDNGKLLITFGPPWYAPYGSHMHFFCKLPWINVFFSEKAVMNVRSHFRCDGATRYEDVESGLNKMSISKFERIVKSSNLKIETKRYNCIKGIDFLSKIPLLREFFINHVTVILS